MESIVEGLIKERREKISELPYLMVNDRISLLELPNYQFQPFAKSADSSDDSENGKDSAGPYRSDLARKNDDI